jgi:hypothetical protein
LNKTPLNLAVEGRHTNVVTMLEGNKWDIGDKDRLIALDIGVKKRIVYFYYNNVNNKISKNKM